MDKTKSGDSRSAYEAVKAGSSAMGPPPRPSPRTPPVKRLSSGSSKSTVTKTKKSIRPKSVASPTPPASSQVSPRDSPRSKSVAVPTEQTTDAEVETTTWTPRERLEKFDQDALLQRYEDQMRSYVEEEHVVWQKIGRLNQLQEAWAASGSAKEVERSRKRLRTRMAYVHHSETKLERHQAHYTQARAALQSALANLDTEDADSA